MTCRGPRVNIYDDEGLTRVKDIRLLSEELAPFYAKSPKARPQAAEEIRLAISHIQAAGGRTFRRGCGNRLDQEINSVPEDGNEYEVECPVCGTRHRVMKVRRDLLPPPVEISEPLE